MKQYEKDALTRYLEFQLLQLVDSVADHVEPLVVQYLYEQSHKLLEDLKDGIRVSSSMSPTHKD